MNHTGFPASSSWPTSMSGPAAIPDRPEAELDRQEMVSQPKPIVMVLRSQSRTGRLVVVISAEIHAEKSGVALRPEPEIARPEVEIAPVAGSSSDRDVVITTGSPMIDSSGEAVKTLLKCPFPARQQPEIVPEPSHSLKPMQQPRFFISDSAKHVRRLGA